MAVLYSDRTIPLSKNASNTAFSDGILLGWDFTGHDPAHSNGVPWIFQGATSPTLAVSGTQTLSTLAGEPGRVAGSTSLYDYNPAATTDYGWQVGTGDWTCCIRVLTGSSVPSTSNSREVLRVSGSAGTAFSLNVIENPSNGWYVTASAGSTGPSALGSIQTAVTYPVNTIFLIWIRRVGGAVTIHTQNVTTQGNISTRYAATSGNTVNFDSTWGKRTIVNFSGATATTPAVNSVTFWNVGHSDSTLNAIGKNLWDTQSNSAVTDSITITNPVSGSTIAASSIISGTYTGTTPSGVQVQHGAGSYVTGTGAVIGSGNWSASFVLPTSSAAPLRARELNNTAVVSADIANITVATDSISFTTPPSTVTGAVPYRLFQRDASDQATVRVTGSYVGSPTSLEYRWNGGTWATLVATPSGGTFDQTVVLTGPGQGSFDVRFSNATGTVGSLAAIGVGDLFLVMGQSNHVGGGAGSAYLPATPPSNHTGWVATILDKTGRWRENVETDTDPFSKTTNASVYPSASSTYPVQATSSTAKATYFGRLATLYMQTGVPVAFVPCALGSTSITNWAVSTSPTTLYGAALARATEVGSHKGVLWWQGEFETSGSTTQPQYVAALNTLVNDWFTRTGRKWFVCAINSTGTGSNFTAIHDAIIEVGQTNPNVFGYADLNGSFSTSIHYETTTEMTEIARRVFEAISVTTVTAEVGNAVATGLTANIVTANTSTINCATGDATASGTAGNIALNTVVSCLTGAASGSGANASVLLPTAITCGVGVSMATGLVATVAYGTSGFIKRGDRLIAVYVNGPS